MKLSRWVFAVLLLSGGAIAAPDVEIVGEITQPVTLPANPGNIVGRSVPQAPVSKQITLLKMQLSERAMQTIVQRAGRIGLGYQSVSMSAKLPAAVQLGMNNVPVLDQGVHGTCVTFANTAAINAALNKGDYISQLCQLQLGLHFANNGYNASGWEGTFGPYVLNQMDAFGIVSKTQQRTYGCGGLTEYPLADAAPVTEMPLPDYHPLSEPIHKRVAWSPILNVYQAMLDGSEPDRVINDIKVALNHGDRATFGVLLADVELGVAGAVGKHAATNDTWILTPQIVRDIKEGSASFGGHEMIITGYDDNAVAVDNEGNQYRGLFTVRNSWGSRIGNKGDFYISYDYLKVLALEAQRIRRLF
ncbi:MULTISPECIES: C1 family peptidase [Legionella]|uniref:Peptidase C1 n=1 Tax=Legionella septentrionalis TaxID=2498109 RepID=A0A433JM71_9GAMM|nr:MULTISPECIES: C1 family peptidase [Legionella]MCP0914790.1 C1 family peptidase [Legionella sp. 27cVA30]RUQ91075.1 peptidase C1 [Legionella septentrionalis]RUR02856.1 peptidase C1 [Legionella septentrionalis]RUR11454.1 peptidase C1 [Legionella septentrionalis]RUR16719.1 peptidase C1 [Legionella septentrionalis]